MMAVPDAWMIRASSRIQKPGASAASNVPALNRPRASAEHRTGRQPLQQEAGGRDDDRHGQHEGGRQPLAQTRADAEIDSSAAAAPRP